MKRRIALTLCSALLVTLGLAACGGDDDNGNGDEGNGNGDSTSVEMGEFYFDPDELEGSAGEEISIELDNAGDQTHTFTIEEGASRGDGFDDWSADGVDIEVESGESGSLTITLPDEAGEFEFICRIPGHYESGQWGTLTVN